MAVEYQRGDLIPGTRYEYLAKLGEGGHGAVLSVRHTFLDEVCAMKVLHSDLVTHEELAARMEREARTVVKLKHPNIVRVTDGGITAESPARPYFVMEQLQGLSLRATLRLAGRVGSLPALRIVIALLEALEMAHRAGVIHRDLKPDNVFMHRGADGVTVPKLLDFGIALLLAGRRLTGKYVLGTPRYIAPEQIRGESATAPTDLYAIGLILYEMLTGRAPYDNLKDAGPLWNAHLNEPLPAPSLQVPDIHPALDGVVAWLTAKAPIDRPPTAFAAAVALRETRRKIELAQAGAIEKEDFKTEPTPMENALAERGPDELAQITEVPDSDDSRSAEVTVPGAPPVFDPRDVPFNPTEPASSGASAFAGGTVPLRSPVERRSGVDRNARTRTAGDAPAGPRAPTTNTAPMSRPGAEPPGAGAVAVAAEPVPPASSPQRTTGGIAIPSTRQAKPSAVRSLARRHRQLIAFAVTLIAIVTMGLTIVLRREAKTTTASRPSLVVDVSPASAPSPSILASAPPRETAAASAAAPSTSGLPAAEQGDRAEAGAPPPPALASSAATSKSPAVRRKAPRPKDGTIDPSTIGF